MNKRRGRLPILQKRILEEILKERELRKQKQANRKRLIFNIPGLTKQGKPIAT